MAELKFPPTQNGLQKNLDAQLNVGVTSQMTLNNTTGIQNKPGVVVIDRIDTSGAEKSSAVREYISYTGVSGNNLTGLTRGLGGSTDQDHAVGAIVEFIPDVTVFQAINDVITTEHGTDGTHDATKVAMLAGTQTFTGAKTFGSGLLKATRPRITTSIDDANGNEVIETPATASAVNQVKITNAATGNAPTVEASGDDTYIPLLLKGKSASPRVGGVYDNGNLTGAVTIDMKKGTRQKGTLTGNVTITISNPSEGEVLELFLLQDATGGRTISFSTTIIWQDDTTPTWTTTASKMNSIVLRYVGSTWYGVGAKFA